MSISSDDDCDEETTDESDVKSSDEIVSEKYQMKY